MEDRWLCEIDNTCSLNAQVVRRTPCGVQTERFHSICVWIVHLSQIERPLLFQWTQSKSRAESMVVAEAGYGVGVV